MFYVILRTEVLSLMSTGEGEGMNKIGQNTRLDFTETLEYKQALLRFRQKEWDISARINAKLAEIRKRENREFRPSLSNSRVYR